MKLKSLPVVYNRHRRSQEGFFLANLRNLKYFYGIMVNRQCRVHILQHFVFYVAVFANGTYHNEKLSRTPLSFSLYFEKSCQFQMQS